MRLSALLLTQAGAALDKQRPTDSRLLATEAILAQGGGRVLIAKVCQIHPVTLRDRELVYFAERDTEGMLAAMRPSDWIVLGKPLTGERQAELGLSAFGALGGKAVVVPNFYVMNPALHVYVKS